MDNAKIGKIARALHESVDQLIQTAEAIFIPMDKLGSQIKTIEKGANYRCLYVQFEETIASSPYNHKSENRISLCDLHRIKDYNIIDLQIRYLLSWEDSGKNHYRIFYKEIIVGQRNISPKESEPEYVETIVSTVFKKPLLECNLAIRSRMLNHFSPWVRSFTLFLKDKLNQIEESIYE